MYERNYHKSVLHDDKQSKPRPKKFPWKNVLLVFGCVMLVGGFVTLTQLNRLQLRTVEVVGAESADPKDISEFVMSKLTGKWLYVFPKTSLVLLPDRALEKSIRSAFPKFQNVSVTRGGTQTITVTVTEFVGTQLWCDEVSDECSFMSTDGVVFAPAPFFSGSAYVKLFGGIPTDYPFVPLRQEQRDRVTLLLEKLRAINIEPSEFHYYATPEKLVIVYYHDGNPAQIILDPLVSTDTTLQSLFTALRTPPFSTRYKDGVSVLEYIDLRLPNKVVYKFK